VAIVVFQLGSLSAHVTWITGLETGLASDPALLASGVAIQIAVTLPIVWWLGRRASAQRGTVTFPSLAQSA